MTDPSGVEMYCPVCGYETVAFNLRNISEREEWPKCPNHEPEIQYEKIKTMDGTIKEVERERGVYRLQIKDADKHRGVAKDV